MSNQWDDWDDWEDWQDWGEPNRYGFYGLNCKNRPSGTGTTHSNRREARRNLQWDNLTKAVPDTEETLASQAAALEKAAEKAKKKLEEMKKKGRRRGRRGRRGLFFHQCELQGQTKEAEVQVHQKNCFGKGSRKCFGKSKR